MHACTPAGLRQAGVVHMHIRLLLGAHDRAALGPAHASCIIYERRTHTHTHLPLPAPHSPVCTTRCMRMIAASSMRHARALQARCSRRAPARARRCARAAWRPRTPRCSRRRCSAPARCAPCSTTTARCCCGTWACRATSGQSRWVGGRGGILFHAAAWAWARKPGCRGGVHLGGVPAPHRGHAAALCCAGAVLCSMLLRGALIAV